jgi:hypothetical protein
VLGRFVGSSVVLSHSTRQAVYEVGLKNPKAPVRAIEGVAENQKSESAGSDTRHRWNVLAEKDPARMPSKAKERAERLFRQQQKAPKALADYRAKQEATRNLTAKLRAERLAREAIHGKPKPDRKRATKS